MIMGKNPFGFSGQTDTINEACVVFFMCAAGAQAAVTIGPTGGRVAAVSGVRALGRQYFKMHLLEK